jgi:RNA polymerase sigma-70 factor (ECF subfamily)
MTVAVDTFLTLPSDETPAPDAGPAAVCRESPDVSRLVDQARAGDAAAFSQLVALHERAVFRAALAALGSRADAEDAAQDAFVMAWRRLSTFRGEAQFRTWLLSIAWRKALDRRRRLALWRTRTSGSIGGRSGFSAGGSGVWSGDRQSDPLANLAEPTASPEARAIASDAARRVRAEITRLTPKLRDTLLLAAGGEHSYAEIAAMLRIPLGTVKWRVAEARRILIARCEGRP